METLACGIERLGSIFVNDFDGEAQNNQILSSDSPLQKKIG
jgi:hypothetical protein